MAENFLVPGGCLKECDRDVFFENVLQKKDPRGLELSLCAAMYNTPLPPHWCEVADRTIERVYFFHKLRDLSQYEHPMQDLFREILLEAQNLCGAPLADRANLLQKYLEKKAEVFMGSLKHWRGPYTTKSGAEYFYNELTLESKWDSPLESSQHMLIVAHSLLHPLTEPPVFDPRQDEKEKKPGPAQAPPPPPPPPPRIVKQPTSPLDRPRIPPSAAPSAAAAKAQSSKPSVLPPIENPPSPRWDPSLATSMHSSICASLCSSLEDRIHPKFEFSDQAPPEEPKDKITPVDMVPQTKIALPPKLEDAKSALMIRRKSLTQHFSKPPPPPAADAAPRCQW